MAVRPERYTDVMMLGSERLEHEQAIEEELAERDGEGAEVRIAKKPRLPTELEVEQHYAAVMFHIDRGAQYVLRARALTPDMHV